MREEEGPAGTGELPGAAQAGGWGCRTRSIFIPVFRRMRSISVPFFLAHEAFPYRFFLILVLLILVYLVCIYLIDATQLPDEKLVLLSSFSLSLSH